MTAACVQGEVFVLFQSLHSRLQSEDPRLLEVFDSFYNVTCRMGLILAQAP